MEEKLNKIIGLLEEIAEIQSIPNRSSGKGWTKEEKNDALEHFNLGISTAKIAILLGKKYGTARSSLAVNLKVKDLIINEYKLHKVMEEPAAIPKRRSILDYIYTDEEAPF